MKPLSILLLLPASSAGFAQMIPNQSVKLEYDTRGNRIVRKQWTQGGQQSKRGETFTQKEPVSFVLYPNPATDHINIELGEADSAATTVMVYDCE